MSKKAQHYLVVGLGVTGLAATRYLIEQGHRVEVADTRLVPPNLQSVKSQYPGLKIHCGRLPTERLPCFDKVVVSPGISHNHPFFQEAAVEGVCLLGDIDLFAQVARAPIIGITGTNGKSTVTTLVGQMCQAAGLKTLVGGNIGVPVLALLAEPTPDVYVLELSSYQLSLTQHCPLAAATILNLAPDHLDRHGTMQAYLAAKKRIYHNAAHVVLPAQDPTLWPTDFERVIKYGVGTPADDNDFGIEDAHFVQGRARIARLSETRLLGTHNQFNLIAAMALSHVVGVPHQAMRTVVRAFTGLPHRCQVIAQQDDVLWVNDSKGTNVAASLAAIHALRDTRSGMVLLLGGQPKSEDYEQLVPAAAAVAHTIILMGQAAAHLKTLLRPYADKCVIQSAHTMSEAVSLAQTHAHPGDMVLLSPACASFDWYDNYEQRGQDFAACIQAQTQSKESLPYTLSAL